MQTSQRQILQNGEVKSMFLAEDSHANLSASQGIEKERMITVTSGRKCCELYKRYDRLGSLVRTLLESYHRVWFIADRTDAGVKSMQETGGNDIHAIGFTPDAKSEQSQWSKFEQPQNSSKEQTEFGRRSCENYSEYTMREWRGFPTQSPICRRNDGFPENWTASPFLNGEKKV